MNNQTLAIVVVVAVLVVGGAYFAFAGPGVAPVATDTQTNATTTVQQAPASTNSGENAQPGGIHGMEPEPAAAAARKALAAKLGISESSIVIMQVEQKTWNDGCLGLGGPAESCMQALVDGFKVEMQARGESYTYRTDKTGASLRAETN